MLFAITVFVLTCTHLSNACGAGGVGGGANADDNRIIQNPTFSMDFSPPVAWTYPENNAQALQSFFPGQPLTQTEANIKANSDIEAAVLAAVVDSALPTQGITVRSAYTAQEISDCRKATGQMTTAGQRFGLVESGAVVRTITPSEATIDPMKCQQRNFYSIAAMQPTLTDYTIQTTVQIEGLTATKFQLRQIARQMMVAMNFRYNARFAAEIQVQ
ncbi:hypothetical protein QR680_002842 [Steinernema hermaphroditum]|uniref:Uncharacterized protein n=1 Tax=Steinernema hermaphroditum TaxID=289476 RepID=A0AA39H4A3_9BILA|nr:hypothetical protein QR680_002842 [Steinernema hermaphroditum]